MIYIKLITFAEIDIYIYIYLWKKINSFPLNIDGFPDIPQAILYDN